MASPNPYYKLKPLRRRKIASNYTVLALTSIGLLILAIIAITFASPLKYLGPDLGECRNIYMYPSYMRINGFDESHTRFAKKYSLFLYREQGKDPDFTKKQGIPVLFIPGNAGSYKQARSILSLTTNLYLDTIDSLKSDKTNLDFFTADFNEDLTAFHGRTLLDQAEYLNEAIKFILSLYELRPEHSRPQSVILLGHSMGGIVARAILTLPNYVTDSVNTIITLATPHSLAPATFDSDVLRMYSEMDNFWRSLFDESSSIELHKLAKQRLSNISLISITGGVPDNTLPADYTQTDGLIPNNQSFTVFTTGIPDVFTSIDHLAIVWCDQLRKKLAQVLLDITTTESPHCTYPLLDRMRIFRRLLLSGFEKMAKQDFDALKVQKGIKNFDIKLKLDNDQINSNTLRIPAKISRELDNSNAKVNMFNIQGQSDQFTLLSSLPFISVKNVSSLNKSPAVVGCRNSRSMVDGMSLIDYTSLNTVKFVELDCIDLANDAHTVPRSMFTTKSISDSSFGGDQKPFHVIQYDPDMVSLFDAILVIESPKTLDENSDDFIIGELQPRETTQLQLGEKSFWKLLTRGYDLSLPSRRPVAVDISVPSAWSSLLSYKIKISGISSLDLDRQKFAPFLRQSMESPLESKWHVTIHDTDTRLITLHGNSPFIQYELGQVTNLHLQLWTDSLMLDEVPLDIYFSIDILNSLRLLVLRYRLAVISFPIAICFLVLVFQLRIFQKTGEFITFWDGVLKLCDNQLLAITLTSLLLLTPLLNNSKVDSFIGWWNPLRFDDKLYHGSLRNSLFLGLRENYLCLLGPMFYIISLSLVGVLYQLIIALGKLLVIILGTLNRFKKKNYKYSSSLSQKLLEDSIMMNKTLNIFKSKKQMIGTISLLGAVSLYIPYQVAYMISCTVQLIVVLKMFTIVEGKTIYLEDTDEDYAIDNTKTVKVEAQLSRSPSSKKTKRTEMQNLLNYQITILNLMIWITPINATLVVVFLHNFSLRWSTPFSSHHNMLAILPILLIVEKNVAGKMITRNERTRRFNSLVCFISSYFALFSLLFGVRNLFCLHHLLNLLFGILLFLY